MKKKYIITLLIVAIVLLIVFKLASNKSKINENNKKGQSEDIRIPVTAATVKEEIPENSMIKTGSLIPFKEVKVLAMSTGKVQRLLFSLGDHVREGQVLATVDNHILQLDLQKSESNVAKLRQDLQTYTELYQGNAATKEKLNEIRQNYQDASNQSQQLRKRITDATIKAPTSGVIGSKAIEEGVYVTEGAELATIVNLSQLKVKVNVTETEVYNITQGQKVKLTTDIYPGKSFEGSITYISPQADQTHSYQVEVAAKNDSNSPLRSGTFVYADFSKKHIDKIIFIPREALIESTRDAQVYVIKNNKAVLRKITTGTIYGKTIEVRSGLAKGEQVVSSGQINLKDGTLISITK